MSAKPDEELEFRLMGPCVRTITEDTSEGPACTDNTCTDCMYRTAFRLFELQGIAGEAARKEAQPSHWIVLLGVGVVFLALFGLTCLQHHM